MTGFPGLLGTLGTVKHEWGRQGFRTSTALLALMGLSCENPGPAQSGNIDRMPKSRKRRQSNPLALERMFDRPVNDTVKIPPAEAPKVLYHYTTWEGAEGIVSSQRFWATAHDCANDEAELVAADSIIIETVRTLRRNATYLTAEVLDAFLKNYAKEQVTLVIPVYMTCFSILRDDREQFRRYGDNGRGLCLGLRMLNEPKA